MRLFSKCEKCGKRAIIIRKRVYTFKHTGEIKSKSDLCRKCYKGIYNMLKGAENK